MGLARYRYVRKKGQIFANATAKRRIAIPLMLLRPCAAAFEIVERPDDDVVAHAEAAVLARQPMILGRGLLETLPLFFAVFAILQRWFEIVDVYGLAIFDCDRLAD